MKPILLFAAAIFLGQLIVSAAVDPAKPNVVFIMADDAGIGDFSAYGCKYGLTPNIDQLAKEGMQFSHAYSGSAVCAPTRCVLMTGLHTGHGLRRANGSNDGPIFLPAGETTVATVFKNAGYATGGFGKWGLGNPGTNGVPEKQGFDLFYGYYDQTHAHNYYTDHLVRNSATEMIPENADGQKKVYSHTLIANETLKFIEDHKDAPFFCYAAWTPPHGDYVIPSAEIYQGKPWPEQVKNYAAMVALIDQDVGRVIQKLKDTGLDKNTLVIFTSDNGANREFIAPLHSTGGLRGFKRMLYEGGVRAPFIARWPEHIAPGSTSDLLTSHVDFLATAAEITGTPAPAKTDGISILPTLLGKEQKTKHDSLYFEIYEPYFQQAVCTTEWKAYRIGTKSPIELYNLKSDPAEEHNIAAEHPDQVKRLGEILDREHVPSPHWNAPEIGTTTPVKYKPNKPKDKGGKNPAKAKQ